MKPSSYRLQCGTLQSARSVWRQSFYPAPFCWHPQLQSARSVWRQRQTTAVCIIGHHRVAICTERVEAKIRRKGESRRDYRCNLHGACGGKAQHCRYLGDFPSLQSARSVWRQRFLRCSAQSSIVVAICTERVEAKFIC